MNNPPVPPNVPPIHTNRRQGDYSYSPAPAVHHIPSHHNPYASHHHPSPYHAPPPQQYYPQPWYPPYQHYAQPAPRQFQQQPPLVVSSYPHAQPVVPASRQPLHTPQPIQTPAPEQSTPSTTSQPVASPVTTASTSVNDSTPPASINKGPATPPAASPPETVTQAPFFPPLPWLSVPESSFPAKPVRRRKKRRAAAISPNLLELPLRQQSTNPTNDGDGQLQGIQASTIEVETPPTSLPPSESESTNPTTPSSSVPATSSQSAVPAPASHKRTGTKPIIPIIPITPLVPANHVTSPQQKASSPGNPETDGPETATEVPATTPAPAKPPPKSWAELLRTKHNTNGVNDAGSSPGNATINGSLTPRSSSLADTLRSYIVNGESKISFLEPRGLVNTGNMCYMNSVLQVLVFCVPFYDFLDQVGKRAVHNFKSDTPLVEAMIMFMREFPIIDSAPSVEQLRMRLKDHELEQFGEPFSPEYVYDVIKRLPRFSTMRRGHQQDAEEFLGFLLEGLHDECVQVQKRLTSDQYQTPPESIVSSPSESSTAANHDGGWLEVGPKQKPAVTRSSGAVVTESPITKIFGGKLRSELRVPGLKNSVTLEPYQPLQLDIGLPNVNNITDALRGLTRSETLQGDFNSPRGPGATAIKQVFIETLPPVLILHLKRFQYDNSGGTQKIWKKIGYPLELEIPKEVFSHSKRGGYTARPGGLPKYRLISVVYHHGKNASGGHYTVDVRRQEGREWVRLDDTNIRRVRSEDVALEGREEDPRVLAKALEEHKRRESAGTNIYRQAGLDSEEPENDDDDRGWSQVNGSTTSPTSGHAKKWSTVANGAGTATPLSAGKQTPKDSRSSVKDNKVAYILFYQQMSK